MSYISKFSTLRLKELLIEVDFKKSIVKLSKNKAKNLKKFVLSVC